MQGKEIHCSVPVTLHSIQVLTSNKEIVYILLFNMQYKEGIIQTYKEPVKLYSQTRKNPKHLKLTSGSMLDESVTSSLIRNEKKNRHNNSYVNKKYQNRSTTCSF